MSFIDCPSLSQDIGCAPQRVMQYTYIHIACVIAVSPILNESEFAKEAMSCQSLDKGEILSIRWAFDDPNPVAQVL